MVIINGICYIIGSCRTYDDIYFKKKGNDFVIAADGGYDLLKQSGIDADILIGDFDSIVSVPDDADIIKYPVEKDDTDSFLAYKLGYDKGYRTFVVLGGIGGRFDHTMANVQMLSHMAKNGSRGFLVGENTVICAIHNSKVCFTTENNGKIGVFAHGGIANDVNISGLKYSLSNGTLDPDIPLGGSNEFAGKNAVISTKNGTLLIVWYENSANFLDKIKIYLEE